MKHPASLIISPRGLLTKSQSASDWTGLCRCRIHQCMTHLPYSSHQRRQPTVFRSRSKLQRFSVLETEGKFTYMQR